MIWGCLPPPTPQVAPGPRHSPAVVLAPQELRHNKAREEAGSCLGARPLPRGAVSGAGQRDMGQGGVMGTETPGGCSGHAVDLCHCSQEGGGLSHPGHGDPEQGWLPLPRGRGWGHPAPKNPTGVCTGLVTGG